MECRHLQEYLLGKYQRGEIKPPDSERIRGKAENQRDDRRRTPPRREPTRAEHEAKNESHIEMKSPKRERPEERQEDNLPPPPRRRISIIMRGTPRAARIAVTTEGPGALKDDATNNQVKHPLVTFNNEDSTGLDSPHNNPLVIALTIADCEVSRILIDTGSSVDVIFKDVLRKMGVDESRIRPERSPLVSFAGDTTISEGTVKLPVYVGNTRRAVRFTIIDKPNIYNAIFGTPWINSMKAIPSTYHQCIKIPLPDGVFTIKGSQSTSRACFVTEQKTREHKG